MNILLTGGTGFLGSHLTRAVISSTAHTVILIKRRTSRIDRIRDLIPSERLTLRDIEDVSPDLDGFYGNNPVDMIVHCATQYGRNDAKCSDILMANLIFPISLLESAVRHRVRAFVNTDSYFCKGDAPYSYLQDYSLSKKCLNLFLRRFSRQIKVVNMILEHPFGEDDSPDKFVSHLLTNIAIRQVPALDLTFGDQKRDFIHIDDVCDAYLKALRFAEHSDLSYRQFEVGTGKSVSLREFATFIKTESKSKTQLNFGAIPYRDDEIMESHANIADLGKLGFSPHDWKWGVRTALAQLGIN